MSTAKSRKSESPAPTSYDAAMAELEEIISEVEDPNAPIDRLAPLVERGAYLVGWCRSTLGQTQARVAEALKRLDADDEMGDEMDDASDEEDDIF